jgi:hypothetical protein
VKILSEVKMSRDLIEIRNYRDLLLQAYHFSLGIIKTI